MIAVRKEIIRIRYVPHSIFRTVSHSDFRGHIKLFLLRLKLANRLKFYLTMLKVRYPFPDNLISFSIGTLYDL